MVEEASGTNRPSSGSQPAASPTAQGPGSGGHQGFAAPTGPPHTGSQPTYGAPQTGSQPTYGAPQTGGQPTYGAPQTGGQPTYGPPQGGAQAPYGQQPGFPQQQAFGAQPAWGGPQTAPRRLRPVGPLLMILGVLACVISLFLTWNVDQEFVDSPDGGITVVDGESWNAFDQISVNQDAGRFYGTLMLVAIIIALLCCVGALISALVTLVARPAGKGAGAIALTAGILGLVATLGVIIGYMVLGASHEIHIGGWLYGFSFIPVLIGAIGVLSKKY